jgi:hypothetical protein
MTCQVPFASKRGKGLAILGPRCIPTPFDKEPLNLRAWTLQERLLSSRAVIYGTDTLAWHCQSSSDRTGSLSPLDTDRVKEIHLPEYSTSYDAPGWRKIAEDYSKRQLTHPGDKLPALAGIARTFHRKLKTRYVAGLWEDGLLDDLLWTYLGKSPERLGNYNRPFVAPSWSWLSVNGRVEYGLVPKQATPKTKLIDLAVQPAGADPFGQIDSASLTVRGPMKNAAMLSEEPERSNLLCLGDGWADDDDSPIGVGYADFNPEDYNAGGLWSPDNCPNNNVSCLLLGEGEICVGLLLSVCRSYNQSPHAFYRSYRRVGVFKIWASSWFTDARMETITIV